LSFEKSDGLAFLQRLDRSDAKTTLGRKRPPGIKLADLNVSFRNMSFPANGFNKRTNKGFTTTTVLAQVAPDVVFSRSSVLNEIVDGPGELAAIAMN